MIAGARLRELVEELTRAGTEAPGVVAWKRSGDPSAYLFCAAFIARSGAIDGVRAHLERAVRLAPASDTVLFVAALLRCAVGDAEAAAHAFDRAGKLSPAHHDAIASARAAYLGNADAATAALEHAERILTRLLGSSPPSPPASWAPLRRDERILLVSTVGNDQPYYQSTIPALALALRKRGLDVALVSPLASHFDPSRFPDGDELLAQARCAERERSYLADIRCGIYDVVIASDVDVARTILASGTLRASARLLIVDFHLLQGFGEWKQSRAASGDAWPDSVTVCSAFRRYAWLYENGGVPASHLIWRPYSLYRGHFLPGDDPGRARYIFAGGAHLRDRDTLDAAADRLRDVAPLHVYGGEQRPGARYHAHPLVPLTAFYAAIASSRFVVVPLIDDPRRAAGITVAVMALLAGRPVVMTATAAAQDYVADGWDGLLVPPGDPVALAEAITRLERDPQLLATLAKNARQSGERFTTDRFADELVSPAPPAPWR